MDVSIDACLSEAGFEYSSSFTAKNAEARAEGVAVLIPFPTAEESARADEVLLSNGYGYFIDPTVSNEALTTPSWTAEANGFLSQLTPRERETFVAEWARCRSAAAASIPFPEFDRQSEAAQLENEAMQRFVRDDRVQAARGDRLACLSDRGFDLGEGDVPLYVRGLFHKVTGLEYDNGGLSAIDEGTLKQLRTYELNLAAADVECSQAPRAIYALVAQEVEAQILAENPRFAEAIDIWLFGG